MNRSACEMIRYLASEQVPYLTCRQVIARLFQGETMPADATFAIQLRRGKRGENIPELTASERKRIQALLDEIGILPDPAPKKKEKAKVAAQTLATEDPTPERPDDMPDRKWLQITKRWRLPEWRSVEALQLELLDSDFGLDEDFRAKACLMEAVRRIRKPRRRLKGD